jgi:hypothetical protein
MIGERFHKLVVVAEADGPRSGRLVLVRCDCETAASFICSYGKRRDGGRRRPIEQPLSDIRTPTGHASVDRILMKRVVLDLAPATLSEVLDCIIERVTRLRDAEQPVPHITMIALSMIDDAMRTQVERPPK